MTNTHPALTSVRLGGLKLDNRFAVAPMTRVSATADGAPTTRWPAITPNSPAAVSVW